jgi:hypothetical protein
MTWQVQNIRAVFGCLEVVENNSNTKQIAVIVVPVFLW